MKLGTAFNWLVKSITGHYFLCYLLYLYEYIQPAKCELDPSIRYVVTTKRSAVVSAVLGRLLAFVCKIQDMTNQNAIFILVAWIVFDIVCTKKVSNYKFGTHLFTFISSLNDSVLHCFFTYFIYSLLMGCMRGTVRYKHS